jgi:hypothetical protein
MKFQKTLLPILVALALGSCGVPNASSIIETSSSNPADTSTVASSESSAEPTTDSSSSAPVVANWTEEEIALMKEHLSDQVIPFYDLGKYTIEWNEDIGIISAMFVGGNAEDYARVLLNSSYIVYSTNDYDEFTVYYGMHYFGEVSSRIVVQTYTYNGFTDIGAWTETPDTEWPTAGVAKFLDNTTTTVPAFEAPYYFVTPNSDSNDYYQIEAVGKSSVAETETAYTTILTDAGWNIDKTAYDEDGIIAISPDQLIKLTYYYLDGSFLIDVHQNIPVDKEWPASKIAAYLGSDVTEVLPSFAWTTGYSNMEVSKEADADGIGYYYVSMECDSNKDLATTETAYLKTLQDAKWIIDDSQYDQYGYFALSPKEQIQISFYCYNNQFNIFINRYKDVTPWTTSEAWPSDVITSYLENGDDEVPAYTATSYQYQALDKSLEVRCPVEGEKVALLDGYAATLETKGYTIDKTAYESDGVYKASSSNSTTKVVFSIDQPSSLGSQYIYIEISHQRIIAPGTFDFTTDDQLVWETIDSKKAALWTSGPISILIEQGSCNTEVGNNGFMPKTDTDAPHSRLYAGQIVTISCQTGYVINSIVFEGQSNSKAGMKAIPATLDNATTTYNNDSTQATTTLTNPASSLSFTVTTVDKQKQIFLTSVVVTYSKAE